MPSNDVTNFLWSLAAAIAAATGLTLDPPVNGKRSMWVRQAVEAASTDVYSVLRDYDYPEDGFNLVPAVSVQIDTRGKLQQAAAEQAMAIHQSLQVNGHPRHGWTIAGQRFNETTQAMVVDAGVSWCVKSIRRVSGPAVVGRDDANRYTAVSSYDFQFVRLVAA